MVRKSVVLVRGPWSVNSETPGVLSLQHSATAQSLPKLIGFGLRVRVRVRVIPV